MRFPRLLSSVICSAIGAFMVAVPQSASAQDNASLLNARCSGCHQADSDGALDRIRGVRKSPEGWDMNIMRMVTLHGIKITADERRQLVKYLSDTQGLAPSETEAWRYILERQPGTVDPGTSELLTTMCSRCHTSARYTLQRRDADEWLKLVHFHLGQYPTTEYQSLGRDRDWFGVAQGPVVKELAAAYPLQTQAWTDWQDHEVPDMSGTWQIVGSQPGRGFYSGSATISGGDNDQYKLTVNLTYADGSTSSREGNGILYTGHEWRSSTKDGDGTSIRQVVSVSADGNTMSGRWYETDNDIMGGTIHATRADNGAQVMAVHPAYVKLGQTSTIIIYGTGLGRGDVSLGSDLAGQVIERSADRVVVSVTSGSNTSTGARNISVGDASLADGLMVYDQVDHVVVTPQATIARVGGGGGPIPKVPAQFEAVGYMAGADGEAGTDDDVRIGVMPATWSVDNFDELAASMQDTEFAGEMSETGLFVPNVAGPNPARKMNTNNAGNLAVIGTVDDDGNKVEGRAQLFVTVQRFVDALIR